jgi:hypothetical protein
MFDAVLYIAIALAVGYLLGRLPAKPQSKA